MKICRVCRLVVAVVVLALGRASAQAQDSGACAPYEGRWKGKSMFVRTGECQMEGGRHSLKVAITAKSSAHVSITLVDTDEKPPRTTELTGTCLPDQLSWQETTVARCGNRQRSYRLVYLGSRADKGGKSKLKMTADDPVCIEAGCTFRRVIELTKE